MGALTTIRLREPYLLLVGDENDVTYAKTASGIVQWRSDAVAGQLRFTEDAVDLGVPDMSVDEARRGGVGSLVVGVAPVGGAVPDQWWQVMIEAACIAYFPATRSCGPCQDWMNSAQSGW